MQRPTTTRDVHITRKASHTLDVVEKSPYVRVTSCDFAYENKQGVPGWMKCRRGRHRPIARALA
eukprot:2264859-Pyramimonas_sp.AAC.1